MKKLSIALILSLTLVLLIVSTGSAALPGSGWWSSLRVQNISSSDGVVSMTAYSKNVADAAITSANFDFGPSEALVYDPGKTANYPTGNIINFDSDLPAGFEGSVVLSANVESASVSQIANYTNGSVGGTGLASAMYQGVSSDMLSTYLLAPTIKHNYSNSTTTMYIQAAGSDADVTVTYTMADGSVYTQTETITANRMFVFDPASAGIPSTGCGYNTNTSPCYGSAIVESTSEIAGVLLEHPHSGTPVTFVQAMRLQTPQDQDTKIYVPSVKNDFCGSSGCGVAGAAVMNVGASTAEVTITVTVTKLGTNAESGVAVGDVFTDTASIAAGTNYNFSKWNDNLGGLPAGTMAAAVIECTNGQPLVGSSNDAKTQQDFPGEAKVKYAAFADTLSTSTAYAPMVKEFLDGLTGGVTVQNVGAAADYVNIEFYEYGTSNVCTLRTKDTIPVGGAAETNWVSVNGGDRFTVSGDCGSVAWLAGKEFSVKAYTDGGEPIIIMVTENAPDGSLDISRYEGINE